MMNHKQHQGGGIPGSLTKISHLLFELDLGLILVTSYTESINNSRLFKDYTGNEVHMQDYNVELLLRRYTCLSSVSRKSAVLKGGTIGKSAKPKFYLELCGLKSVLFCQKVRGGEGISKRVQADEVSSGVSPTVGRNSADVNTAEV